LGIAVRRPQDQETTALGAAYLAGLAHGLWPDLTAISTHWIEESVFQPAPENSPEKIAANSLHHQWLNAVARSRDWAAHS